MLTPLSLSLRPQLASAGTFRVVKEPLAFLRVLEWVSPALSGVAGGVVSKVRARRNRWERGRAQGWGHGARRGRGLASCSAVVGLGLWVTPLPILVLAGNDFKGKKKKKESAPRKTKSSLCI